MRNRIMPIHLAITRRVRPGCEAAFQHELREFLRSSFEHEGVWGASMLTPHPGSNSREFGILRSFADEKERDAFYDSPMFKAWDERARTLTEGETEWRQLHGLEAWFRSPNPPPRWKMAACTLAGVFPLSVSLGLVVGPLIHGWPFPTGQFVFALLMVVLLTWVVMPLVIRIFHRWLHPSRS